MSALIQGDGCPDFYRALAKEFRPLDAAVDRLVYWQTLGCSAITFEEELLPRSTSSSESDL